MTKSTKKLHVYAVLRHPHDRREERILGIYLDEAHAESHVKGLKQMSTGAYYSKLRLTVRGSHEKMIQTIESMFPNHKFVSKGHHAALMEYHDWASKRLNVLHEKVVEQNKRIEKLLTTREKQNEKA